MMPKTNVTKKQAELLQALIDYTREHNLSPSLHELGDMFGVSHSSVYERLRKLEAGGFITREPYTYRSVRVTPLGMCALGMRSAGGGNDAVDLLSRLGTSSKYLHDMKATLIRDGYDMASIIDVLRDAMIFVDLSIKNEL